MNNLNTKAECAHEQTRAWQVLLTPVNACRERAQPQRTPGDHERAHEMMRTSVEMMRTAVHLVVFPLPYRPSTYHTSSVVKESHQR